MTIYDNAMSEKMKYEKNVRTVLFNMTHEQYWMLFPPSPMT